MRSLRKIWIWVAITMLAGAGIGIATRALAVHPVRVTSGSMVPTIEVGDWIAADTLDARQRSDVHRRDIVVFRFPLGTTGRAVKRVIAIGGDTVAYTDRYVSVNGTVTRIAGSPSTIGADGRPTGRHLPRRVVRVPTGHVFLLGDNSAVSIDSRSIGPVPDTELVGRVRLVIPSPPRWSVAALAATAVAIYALVLTASSRRRRHAA